MSKKITSLHQTNGPDPWPPHLLAVLHRGAHGFLDEDVVRPAVADDVHEYLVVGHVRGRHDDGVAEPAVQQLAVA